MSLIVWNTISRNKVKKFGHDNESENLLCQLFFQSSLPKYKAASVGRCYTCCETCVSLFFSKYRWEKHAIVFLQFHDIMYNAIFSDML